MRRPPSGETDFAKWLCENGKYLREGAFVFARILPPYNNCTGNLLWRKEDLVGHEDELTQSLIELGRVGYWASAFPEGDGVTFTPPHGLVFEQVLADFSSLFPWLVIQQGLSGDGNTELAELEEQANVSLDISCTVIVPLECVHLEGAVGHRAIPVSLRQTVSISTGRTFGGMPRPVSPI